MSLLNQLIDIGSEHIELLIACLVLVVAIGVTVVLFCVCVVLSIPFLVIYSIVKLCIWLYRRNHPAVERVYEDKVSEPKRRKKAPGKEPEELTPVYPDWMNKKGGRLL